jgi:predicted Rossmann-fold nucleotide-binding protein
VLVEKGMISASDLKLFNFCSSVDEVFDKVIKHLQKHYSKGKEPLVIEPVLDLK